MNIGFIGTRFAGLDGVSLEAAKWAEVLENRMDHTIFWFAGELDKEMAFSYLVPEAYFKHPANEEINSRLFGKRIRDRITTNKIMTLKDFLKDRIYEFIKRNTIQMLIAENCFAIPIHIPLGLALTEVINETGIPTIGHHHDFTWERTRFLVNAISDYIDMSFPPSSPSIRHVVINSIAQTELAARKGLSSIIIPNVLDFQNNKNGNIDDFNKDIREDLGFDEDDIIFLQPTRIVARKNIETAINLVARLKHPRTKLVVSHSSGDEGMDYLFWLKELAQSSGIQVYFIDNKLHERRMVDQNGKKIYSLWDLYPYVDFITYPSSFEGFGNAFLEAVYFKKPILVNRYSIFVADIEPKGFQVVSFDGFLSDKVVEKVNDLIAHPEMVKEMVDTNFELAKKHFSYDILKRKLKSLFTEFYGELS